MSIPRLVELGSLKRNVVKYGKYSLVKFVKFVYIYFFSFVETPREFIIAALSIRKGCFPVIRFLHVRVHARKSFNSSKQFVFNKKDH